MTLPQLLTPPTPSPPPDLSLPPSLPARKRLYYPALYTLFHGDKWSQDCVYQSLVRGRSSQTRAPKAAGRGDPCRPGEKPLVLRPGLAPQTLFAYSSPNGG